MRRVFLLITLSAALGSSPVWAQGGSSQQPVESERMATATYWGDTGLWFVPTAEVVKPKGWSFSIYRTEFDFRQGQTDVSDWPITVAIGAGSRLEIFGALRAVTRIDRDTRPLFQPVNESDAGLTNERPYVRETWTGNDLGDLYLGTKVNLISERTQRPMALALRGTVKMPTADDEKGAGSGEWDYFADVVASKEISRRVELTGFTGFAFRGDPPGLSLSDGVRWGVGAAFGARANLRLTTEVFGEYIRDSIVAAQPGLVTGIDGSLSPRVSDLNSGVTSAVGLTWQHSSGVSLGAGLTYQSGLEQPADDDTRGWGMQFRLGFHRGVSIFVPPPPPPRIAEAAPPPPPPAPAPPPPAPPPPPANRNPTLRAACDPCRVEVGRTATIRVDSQDPDGDTLNYRWVAPTGTLADTRMASTTWTAETVPGPVTLTVTADDGRGGTATTTVNIEVVRAAAKNLVFEEVHFDFDRAELRPEAMSVLEQAVRTLKENPEVRIRIEGHASEEGTPDYNNQLGDRRATVVRDYLVKQGIDAVRLTTTSFGETRPKYGLGADSESRRLNRRVAMVVAE